MCQCFAYVYVCGPLVLAEVKRGCQTPGSGVRDIVKPLCRCSSLLSCLQSWILFSFFFLLLRQDLAMYLWLAWNSLCKQGWLLTVDPPGPDCSPSVGCRPLLVLPALCPVAVILRFEESLLVQDQLCLASYYLDPILISLVIFSLFLNHKRWWQAWQCLVPGGKWVCDCEAILI